MGYSQIVRQCRHKLYEGRIMNLTSETYESIFGHLVGLLGGGISPSQGLYLYRTTQHRKKRTHIHASSGIRTHDPSARAVKRQYVPQAVRPLGPAD